MNTTKTPTAEQTVYKRIAKGLCPKCGKPPDGATQTCTTCLELINKTAKRKRNKHRESGKCPGCGGEPKARRKYCEACLKEVNDLYNRRKAQGICINCGKVPATKSGKCDPCHEKTRARNKVWHERLRLEVMNAYGGPVCKCCGESHIEFLTIDHIHGGGNQHRKSLRGQKLYASMYSWLKKHGFPPGFQVLCMNCNWAKGKYGECPHVLLKR